MTPASLFFDLDGTLTDPREGIVRSFQHALRHLGLPDRPDAELEALIGPPLLGSFEKLLAEAPPSVRAQASAERAVLLYREHFADRGLFENRVHDGIPDQLERLRRAGHALLVVTSKPAVYAERILSHFALRGFFTGVYGPDLAGNLADKRELIAHVLACEALSPTRAVMIGDRSHDVVGARASGVRAIGVLWGFGDRAELDDAGAWRICAAPHELEAIAATA